MSPCAADDPETRRYLLVGQGALEVELKVKVLAPLCYRLPTQQIATVG